MHTFRTLAMIAVLMLTTACGGKKERVIPADFAAVEKEAAGTTVRWFMWGGSSTINAWVDSYVAPEMKKRYNITLQRVPADASVFVNKLLAEKRSGVGQGSIDQMWINGENFKNAKSAGLLYGPYAERLPNFSLVDPAGVAADFGYPVDGFESPYGRAQFVFEYDSARIKTPPTSFAELADWVKRNPGRFSYPQPPDFTGSAFIRQVFYAVTGGHAQYAGAFDAAKYDANALKLFSYLNELRPHLWKQGRTYPKDIAALDLLFEKGAVDFNMSYHQASAAGRILQGRYPATVRTFVMKDGSIYNTHFVAIAYNAPNKAGALVTANFLLSPEAQLSKNDPKNWGDFTVLDMKRLDAAWRKKFEALDLGAATLPLNTLAEVAVPEIAPEYLERMETGWNESVLKAR